MYINTIGSNLKSSFERILLGTSERAVKKLTNIGEFRGVYISVDYYFSNSNKIIQKKYTFWNNSTKVTYYKNINKEGKFDLLT